MKKLMLLCLILSNFSTVLAWSKSGLTYIHRDDKVGSNKLEWKFPVDMYWEYNCGRDLFYFTRDEILRMNEDLGEELETVDIIYKKKGINEVKLNLNRKRLTINFVLTAHEDKEVYCGHDIIMPELEKLLDIVVD